MINNYVYWIENRGTNVSYVGVRSCDIEPVDDIGVKYFTSSQDKEFKQDFTNNPEKYNIDIINNFIERQEAINLEVQIHNWNDVGSNDKFYNKAKQTSSGFDRAGVKDTPEELERKRGQVFSKEARKKMSIANRGKDNPNYGKKHSAESRKKMSENHWDSSGKNNPMFGKHRSKETKQKISEAFKGEKHPMYGKKQPTAECIHCGVTCSRTNISRWHNDNCKYRE